MNRTNVLEIRTAEGISFSLPLAGPLVRFFAWVIDFLAILVATSAAEELLGILASIFADLASALVIAAGFVLYVGYAMALEWFWGGQTVGKRLFGLRVVDAAGLRLRPDQVVVRNLLRAIDSLPVLYLVGGACSFFSPLSQRLGDLVAGTVVIETPNLTTPPLQNLIGQKFNSLREHAHLVARLRRNISPLEAELGLQAILRRDEFDDVARVELFDRLSELYQGKVALPEQATVGLTSEQFVRNVIDVVYR